MLNFIEIITNILDEQGKTPNDLFSAGVVSANNFYKYKVRYPSLKTLLKIANFLEVDLDYMFYISNENNFKRYSSDQSKFYDNLIGLIKLNNLSLRQFCRELKFARANLTRWKTGTSPGIETLFDIVRYFNCSFNDLLTGENNW